MAPATFQSSSVPSLWDAHVEEYAAQHARMSRVGVLDALVSSLLDAANAIHPFSSATSILDNGCGTGLVLRSLFASQYGSQVPASAALLAADFSPKMIEFVEQAKEKPENKAWKRARTLVNDATDLKDVQEGSLSHVLGNLMIFGVSDPRKALKEMHRVLAPGGAVGVTSFLDLPWIDIWEYAHVLRPDAEWDLKVPEDFRSVKGVEGLMEEAGFRNVVVTKREAPLKMGVEMLRGFLGSFIGSHNPLSVQCFGDLGKEELEKAVELMMQGVRKEYGEGEVTFVGSTLTVSGRK